ncbi:Alpha/Beta hydrolase protein [Copromyces sp. CBS 386.78]|nr:Alpha/Beta hydrolase protein [Copromyces sp. CBS 386.78]
MPHPHYTTFEASDGALLTFKSSLPIENPDPSFIPTSPILTFTGPTGTTTSGTVPTGTTDTNTTETGSGNTSGTAAGTPAANRLRSASKASVIAEEGPNYSRLILLLHGFSGSSEYFDRNFDELAKNHWVVAWDMRGHGKSGLRKKKRKPRAGMMDDDDAEEEEEEGKEVEENQDARERDAGKRDEGTEGQNKAAGAKQGKPPGHNSPKKKEKYDTYTGGYHVARLAVDLKNMLDFIKTSRLGPDNNNNNNNSGSQPNPKPPLEIVAIGCSIGAAILWTYIELFTDTDFSGLIFVDQAPLQDRSPFGSCSDGDDGVWDATKSHKGCYDERTMLAAQAAWNLPPSQRHATHLALVDECLGYRYEPLPTDTDDISEQERKRDEDFFTRISAQCPSGEWLARLIADHTRYDHREACEGITCPVLVMGGKRSGCFSLEGMEEVVKRARKGGNEKAQVSWYESGHWLFWEEADKFNGEVLEFVRRCWSE